MTNQTTSFSFLGLCLAAIILLFVMPDRAAAPTITMPAPPIPSPEPQLPPRPQQAYRAVQLEGLAPIVELEKAVGAEQVPIVLALNRIDAGHLKTDALVVVPDPAADMRSLSPFPAAVESLALVPKALLVSQKIQAFAAYEYGILVRWGATSTGKASTPTPSRLYYANWKGKLVISTINAEWIMPWYFNLANFEGISMHQYDLPGYPASHACVRFSEADAMWMYEWAEQWLLDKRTGEKQANGTPVIVFGEYAYGEDAPWKALPVDPAATTLSIEAIDEAIAPYLSDIHASIEARERVIGS